MTIISAKLFKALKQAGVDEHLAEEAAEEVISFDKKIDNVNNELDKKYDNLSNDIKILNTKFNIMLGLMTAVFTMLLALCLQLIIK